MKVICKANKGNELSKRLLSTMLTNEEWKKIIYQQLEIFSDLAFQKRV